MTSHLPAIGLASALLLVTTAVPAEPVKHGHGGLTLNANLETTGGDWQKGPVVLMTHGTLAHGRMEIMQGLQAALKDRGISSLSITLSLGLDDRQGMYECKTPHTHRHTDAVDEIGAWLGWLRSQGVAKAALLGHSRGGNQTARFAAGNPAAPVTAVVLIAPQTATPDHGAEEYQKRFGKPLAAPLARAQQLVGDGKGATMLENVDLLYCADTSASAASFASYYGPDERMDTPRLIPEMQAPVLVIAGSEDEVVKGLAGKVEPLADGRRVKLQVVDGADHFFRDLYAEDAADAVKAALAGP